MAQRLVITSTSAIQHVLTHRPERISRLCFRSQRRGQRLETLYQQARARNIFVEQGHSLKADEQVRAYLNPFPYLELSELIYETRDLKRSAILALDHIQDPQNFGALCRTAEGFGLNGILLPKDRSVAVGPGVYHASVGAVETVNVTLVSNLGESLKRLKENDYWVVGTSVEKGAKPPWKMPDFEKIVYVLGSEGEGMGDRISKLCDWQTQIPLKGQVQSLNVSVAGSLLMYEHLRRSALGK